MNDEQKNPVRIDDTLPHRMCDRLIHCVFDVTFCFGFITMDFHMYTFIHTRRKKKRLDFRIDSY